MSNYEYGEPFEARIKDNGDVRLVNFGGDELCLHGYPEYAKRIVTSVNACAGLDMSNAGLGAVKRLVEAAKLMADHECQSCSVDCEQVTEFERENCPTKELISALAAFEVKDADR